MHQHDFFLINRAHQIARLIQSPAVQALLPSHSKRGSLSTDFQSFRNGIERVCEIAERQRSNAESTALDDGERAILHGFERDLVRQRFSKDTACKRLAVALIRAIFADSQYFYGLKPLPQYTDVVAYELLFPSWLNLLTATMLPRQIDGKQRLSDKSQAALFHFLGRLRSTLNERDEGLWVGYLTFIASRFDAPQCEQLLQRLVDLAAQDLTGTLSALRGLEALSTDAHQLRQDMRSYLVAQYAMSQPGIKRACEIAYGNPTARSIPHQLREQLERYHRQPDAWQAYLAIARPLAHLVESQHLLIAEYVELINQRIDQAAALLDLLVVPSANGTQHVLSPEGQYCVAAAITAGSSENHGEDLLEIGSFTRHIACNLDSFSERTIAFFRKQLIDEAANRRRLLGCGDSLDQRRRMSDALLVQVATTQDDNRALTMLCCASAICGGPDASLARTALLGLEAVVDNRTIGNRELSDLVQDLREHAREALDMLAAPLRTAASKNARLASLYLTLHEIATTLQATGKADNFSVIRAKYVNLTRSGDD